MEISHFPAIFLGLNWLSTEHCFSKAVCRLTIRRESFMCSIAVPWYVDCFLFTNLLILILPLFFNFTEKSMGYIFSLIVVVMSKFKDDALLSDFDTIFLRRC